MNGNSGLTAGDLALLRDNNDFTGGGSTWMFFLFFLLLFGNGNGILNNRLGESIATSADLQRGFDTNTIVNKLDGITNGLCQTGYELNNSIKDNSFATQTAINNLSHNVDDCCCTTNRNIDAVRYENAKNTCDIINAIHADGEATRSLITQNTIQDLRDKINERDRELQSAQFQISQISQTSNIVNQIKPCPIPAYLSCSPYASYNPSFCGCNSTVI